jgi:hypothetical protein
MSCKTLPLILCCVLLGAASLFAAETVEIYADFSPGEFGRAKERDEVKQIPLSGFGAARTLAAPGPDGILTAVVLDYRVVDALTAFLTDYHERRLGSAWFWLEEAGGRKIFHYYDDSGGLKFSFSAEKPNAEIIAMIEAFYRRDPRNKRDVADHYRKNYVIRVHSAENIIDPWINSINFEEALTIAALIGDTTQELWGIRDGAGLLRNLPVLIAAKAALSLYQYRPIEKNEAEYLTFIRRVRDMSGSFVRNLHFTAMNEFETKPYYDFQLPEEFVVRGHGKAEDLVLFYADVLLRMGFQIRLLAVARDAETPMLVTLFREEGQGNWSALTERDIFTDAASHWRRVPGVIQSGETIWFHELDYERIFREKKIYEVPPGAWEKSTP